MEVEFYDGVSKVDGWVGGGGGAQTHFRVNPSSVELN